MAHFTWLRQILCCLACFGMSMFLSAPVLAQPIFSHAESVELTVANAGAVVVGKLVKIGDKQPGDENIGGLVTIAVEETLKGKHREELMVRTRWDESTLVKWKDEAARLLVAAKGGHKHETRIIDLSSETTEVMAADFTVLRKPDDVIRVAKETTLRLPGITRIASVTFLAPREAYAGTHWAEYGGLDLSVPVDDRLQQGALKHLATDDYILKEESARALRCFKTDENITLMKELLNDPSWGYLRHPQHNRGIEVRIYGIRQAAYETLTYWGVKVKKPLIREEIEKLDEVKLESLSNQKITSADLKDLARFENLYELHCFNSEFTDDSFQELAHLKNLKNLLVGGTNIQDQDLKHLAELKHLRCLGLSSTPITDQGLNELAGFKSLEKLELKAAKVTDKGVARLRELRPDLTIER